MADCPFGPSPVVTSRLFQFVGHVAHNALRALTDFIVHFRANAVMRRFHFLISQTPSCA
jgi:hypothetical protein